MKTETSEIRGRCLDSRLVGREHILEAWREATGPAFECEPLEAPGDFDAAIAVYNLDGLLVSRSRFGAARFERSGSMIRQDGSDSVAIGHYVSGSIRGRVGDRDLRMTPDRVCFQDLGEPFVGLADASEVLSVVIPRDRVAGADRLRIRRQPETLALPLSTARGSLLAGTMQALWDELSAGRIDQPATIADAFLGLVNGLVEGSVEVAIEEQPRPLMEQYLRERLADPSLGPEHLQRAFHYSRSAVYRLFERHGGVAAFIRSERLRRCHADLVRSTTPCAVSTVAARYGFHDPSHFSRAFRERYGIAPSEVVSAATRRAGTHSNGHAGGAAINTIKLWFETV